MKQRASTPVIEPAQVASSLDAIGVHPSPDQCELIARHASSVLEANARMNLTRITSVEDVLALHIVDSLAFLAYADPISGQIVDIGSGAGYPGIPLAALGYNVRLCESIKKKAVFLEECVADLGLSVPVDAIRAEELAQSAPRSVDVVVARAVSSLAALVELASPLLREGGRLIALKGDPDSAERLAALQTAVICGMRLVAERAYELPGGEARTVFTYQRAGVPLVRLPRRPGLAQKHPFV